MLATMEQFVGSQELTRLLGVSRARVFQLARTADFPRPISVLAMGSIWRLVDVQAWADKRGRTLNVEALTTDVQADDDSTP